RSSEVVAELLSSHSGDGSVGVPDPRLAVHIDTLDVEPADDRLDRGGGVDQDVGDITGDSRATKLDQLLAPQDRLGVARVDREECYASRRSVSHGSPSGLILMVVWGARLTARALISSASVMGGSRNRSCLNRKASTEPSAASRSTSSAEYTVRLPTNSRISSESVDTRDSSRTPTAVAALRSPDR